MPAPAWLATAGQVGQAALPSAANLFSLFLQRKWAKKDLAAQNEYNSPKAQLERLKDAGLPAAAFFSGGVSSQSDQPRGTEVSPDLGTSEIFGKYALNRIQKGQLELLDEQVKQARIGTDLKSAELEWMRQNLIPGVSNQHMLLNTKAFADIASLKGINLQNAIREIDRGILQKYGLASAGERFKGLQLENRGIELSNVGKGIGNLQKGAELEIFKRYADKESQIKIRSGELANALASVQLNISRKTSVAEIEAAFLKNNMVRKQLEEIELRIGDAKLFASFRRELAYRLHDEPSLKNDMGIFRRFIEGLMIKFLK